MVTQYNLSDREKTGLNGMPDDGTDQPVWEKHADSNLRCLSVA